MMLTNMKIKTKRHLTITQRRLTITHRLELRGSELIEVISQELAAQGADRIPTNASVVVHVPGGGNWSNMELDLSEHPVVIEWSSVKED